MTTYYLISTCTGISGQPCGVEIGRTEITEAEWRKLGGEKGEAISSGLCVECQIKATAAFFEWKRKQKSEGHQ